jgi:hypothetical protein
MTWLAVIATVVITAPPDAPAPPAPAIPPPAAAPVAAAPESEAPPTTAPDLSGYGEAKIRAGFEAAQAARGPLEGRWRLALADGQPLYAFEISDSGGSPDARAAAPIEGAWRDLRRPDALDASGVFATVKRESDRLSILFYEGDAFQARTISLDAASADLWTGELVTAGAVLKVVMRRY